MDDRPQQITALEQKAASGSSPLFAQLAGLYLESGRPQDALRVCEEGLAQYPFYTTGHLIRGKALMALKMNTEARREFTWVLEFMPGSASVKQLLELVPSAEEESFIALTPASPARAGKTIAYQTPPAPQAPFVPPAPPAAPEPTFEIPKEESSPFGLPTEPPTMDFGVSSEPDVQSAPNDFGMPAETAPASDFGGFTGLSETPPSVEPSPLEAAAAPTEDPFGFGGMAPPAAETTADSFGSVPTEPPAFAGFESPVDAPMAEQTPAADFSFGPAPSEEESFEAYAARVRNDLSGENSISLEQYLNAGSPAVVAESAPSSPSIEELADKLQAAKKITPVINFAAKTANVSESSTAASTGFVTPTLAEIYAKQGWFDDAIKAYKTLANNKPAEKEKFLNRIAELEELKKQSES